MISSPQNPLVKEFRRLHRDRRARREAGLFVVEGIQNVVAAVQSGAQIDALLFAPELLTSEVAHAAIASARGRGVRVEEIAASLFQSISERDNPVGIAALVRQRLATLADLHAAPGAIYVALDQISDPGNLGTVIRTVDAVGGAGLFLVGSTVDPFHPTVVKASAGTLFALPLIPTADLPTLLDWCERERVTVVATSDRAPRSYWKQRYATPLLLLMGSEAHGLPADLLNRLPHTVSIPMHGTADSLNLAVATALVLYEVRRQQQEA